MWKNGYIFTCCYACYLLKFRMYQPDEIRVALGYCYFYVFEYHFYDLNVNFVLFLWYHTLPEIVAIINYVFDNKAEVASGQRNWWAINKYALFHE